MKIGGFQKFSLIDYPGKLTSTVFTQGCNFRCPYCHNPELVNPRLFREPISLEEIVTFLEKRRGKIDAVTISGGEPTLQQDLPVFARRLKDMGYLIKLDTNGSNPFIIESLLDERLVDFIAMDIKTTIPRYSDVVNCPVNTRNIRKSIHIVMQSEVEYEFRTTLARPYLSPDDVLRIGDTIKTARRYALQQCIPIKTLYRGHMKLSSLAAYDVADLEKKLKETVVECIVR